MSVQDLMQEAAQLSFNERKQLIQRLVDSLDLEPVDEENE